jgi:hypothetical protein
MCVALAWPVMAATTDSSTNTGANSAASNGSMNNNGSTTTTPQISAKLRQSLAQSGYTDIQVVPEAFLVHAKDKGGNPVMMMVRPNSVTEITQLSGPAGTGSGAQPGMNGNNATGSGQSSGSTSGQTKQ